MFLGFDRSGYPGDEVMQSLWDSVQDLTFVCLYLAPAPSHPNEAWMDAVPTYCRWAGVWCRPTSGSR
jgi:hypothetical protein